MKLSDWFRRKPFNTCPLCKGSLEYKFKPAEMRLILDEEYKNLHHQVEFLEKQVRQLAISQSRVQDENKKLQEILAFDPNIKDRYELITQKFKHDIEANKAMLNIKDL